MIFNDRIKQMLSDLGVNEPSSEDQEEITQQLLAHFNKIIVQTLIVNLDDNQLERLNNYMESVPEEELDEKIMSLSAEIPGLQLKIEEAVTNEFENLRTAKKVLDK